MQGRTIMLHYAGYTFLEYEENKSSNSKVSRRSNKNVRKRLARMVRRKFHRDIDLYIPTTD